MSCLALSLLMQYIIKDPLILKDAPLQASPMVYTSDLLSGQVDSNSRNKTNNSNARSRESVVKKRDGAFPEKCQFTVRMIGRYTHLWQLLMKFSSTNKLHCVKGISFSSIKGIFTVITSYWIIGSKTQVFKLITQKK